MAKKMFSSRLTYADIEGLQKIKESYQLESDAETIEFLLEFFKQNSESEEIAIINSLMQSIYDAYEKLQALRDFGDISEKANQFFNVLNFAEQLLIRTPFLLNNPDNYVDVPTEMLDPGEEHHKTYRYAVESNKKADDIIKKLLNENEKM